MRATFRTGIWPDGSRPLRQVPATRRAIQDRPTLTRMSRRGVHDATRAARVGERTRRTRRRLMSALNALVGAGSLFLTVALLPHAGPKWAARLLRDRLVTAAPRPR